MSDHHEGPPGDPYQSPGGPYGQPRHPAYGGPSAYGQPRPHGYESYPTDNRGGNAQFVAPPPPPGHYGPPTPYGFQGSAPRPGVLELRPQDVGDVFSVSWRTLTKRFWTTTGLLLLPGAVALVLVGLYVWLLAANGVFDRDYDSSGEVWNNAPGVFTIGLALLAVFYIVTLAATTGLTHVFSQAVLGERPGVMACFGVGLRRMWSVLGSSLLLGLAALPVIAVLFGLGAAMGAFDTTAETSSSFDGSTSTAQSGGNPAFALLYLVTVLALYAVMIRFSFAATIAVVEEAGPLQSLRRSWKLTKGRFWRLLGIMILVGMAVTAAMVAFMIAALILAAVVGSSAFGAQGELTSGQVVALVSAIIVFAVVMLVPWMFTQPFMMNATSTLYVDARIRDENFAADLARAAGTARRPGF